MRPESRKQRIARAFASQAYAYDSAAEVQRDVANRMALRIKALALPKPAKILEIGCGTGFLSVSLASAFPDADLLLTDLAPTMLDLCRAKVGDRPRYRALDGEQPEGLNEHFDLITASLTFQWFVDLASGLERLAALLAPGGRLVFATLGCDTFVEWRDAHEKLGLMAGTPVYPSSDSFPWPSGFEHRVAEEKMHHHYRDGNEFIRTLKALGASEPAADYRPLTAGEFRRVLKSVETGLDVTYHVIYGEIMRGRN
jgi:malonyl-CoA O-methyltransferase